MSKWMATSGWKWLVVIATVTTVSCSDGSPNRNGGIRGAADGIPAPGVGAQQEPVDIEDIGYDQGLQDAPVLVIEFSDFGCPYCARFAMETYPALHREFVMTGKVRWKFVPFVLGIFPNGAEATRSAECAAEQGEQYFWDMHDMLYEHQAEWKSTRAPESLFRTFASEIRLDETRFTSCYEEDRGGSRTRVNNLVASTLGIHATPSFLVNGMLVRGALPLEQFRMVLNDALRQ